MSVFTTVDDAINSRRHFTAPTRRLQPGNTAHTPLHVRIGFNAGNPVEYGGDLFGITVQMASRVCDHAQPDQILVTGIIRELCDDSLGLPGYRDAGRAVLKGLPSAVQLYEIVWLNSLSDKSPAASFRDSDPVFANETFQRRGGIQ